MCEKSGPEEKHFINRVPNTPLSRLEATTKRSMKVRKFFTTLTMVAALGSGSVQAEPYNFILAGASPGGLWSLLGAGIDLAVNQT